jgi:uncharacterized protein YbdZ (MbtH family)
MTTQIEDETVSQPEDYDPFPQPQTIPAGWDVSVLFSDPDVADVVEVLAETDSF